MVIKDKALVANCNNIIKRSKKGIPSYIIVWGPTRSGKTTLSIQCCQYIANELGVPFNVNQVFFKAYDLLEEAKGKKNGTFLLDEGAFDLMSNEWQKQEQKNLVKYIMTAAKYAQVFFIAIPKLHKLSHDVIEDDWSRGLEVYMNKDYTRRLFKGFSQKKLDLIWSIQKDKKYRYLKNISPGFRGIFTKDLGDFDVETYENKKDEAIASIGGAEKITNREKKYAALVISAKKYIMSKKGVSLQDWAIFRNEERANLSQKLLKCAYVLDKQ